MLNLLKALIGTPKGRNVVIESEDGLGYIVAYIPVVPDTADQLLALTRSGR